MVAANCGRHRSRGLFERTNSEFRRFLAPLTHARLPRFLFAAIPARAYLQNTQWLQRVA